MMSALTAPKHLVVNAGPLKPEKLKAFRALPCPSYFFPSGPALLGLSRGPSRIGSPFEWHARYYPQVEARLLNQTPNTLRATLAPKASAAHVIGDIAGRLALSFTMFFSSISVLVGSAGHANYCAANAVLDAVAAVEGEQGLPTLAIDWGAWSSVGTIWKL